MEDDKQLNLVENYLLKLRYSNDMKYKNNIDFGYLTKKQINKKKNDSSDSGFYMSSSAFSQSKQSNDSNLDDMNQLSFGKFPIDEIIEEEQEHQMDYSEDYNLNQSNNN